MRAVTVGVALTLAIIIALGVAGCSGSLLDSELPVSTTYVIAPAAAAQATGPVMPVDVSIGRPDMAPGLDTERIAVLKGRQLDYYRGARWGDNAIEVVQTLLVDSLEDQRLFRSVTAEQARVAGDYVLDIEVRDFQAEYAAENAAPSAHVTIVGRLIRVVDRELVATILAESHGKAQDNRLGAVIAAFEAAAHEVALDLARKTAVSVTDDVQKLRSAQGTGEVATP
jgi:cholesterol transport system auxiliary component